MSYLHGGGIDRPLVITKGGTSVIPHDNWGGTFATGTLANGQRAECHGTVVTNCLWIVWPGWKTTASHAAETAPSGQSDWWGGLVDGMRDASGRMYIRNRYNDPATGQFTQTDPIGVEGGLNTYGFAAGDPVSYDDPFGLKVRLRIVLHAGGAMTYMPWRGWFNDDARVLIDPARVGQLWNVSALVALGHELGHAHAIMYGLTDKNVSGDHYR
ncbi:RHS repeat-associated core domain-containing protein [Longimicrobium terrae]|uniref:RHS repeat-associated protein n=1 Tax=Longimicrobium terrae TaxID=1639882 RepID=A0A841H1R4_9BACT|nr:RHS repeat-associated protein [Longimicrobium terrae]MBB6071957.1 RHS repeat-associated protein [Longimicrobium terrae]